MKPNRRFLYSKHKSLEFISMDTEIDLKHLTKYELSDIKNQVKNNI